NNAKKSGGAETTSRRSTNFGGLFYPSTRGQSEKTQRFFEKSGNSPPNRGNYRMGRGQCQRNPPRLCRVPKVFRTWYHQVGAKLEGFRLPLLKGACAPPS